MNKEQRTRINNYNYMEKRKDNILEICTKVEN